jgi:quercetin dioxygenase-like cupin family protein
MSAATVADLGEMTEVAENGIVSKSIVENDHHKIIHFTFAPGQELSEHTASVPAAIHILDGRGRVVLDGETYEAKGGMLFYMPAEMRHAVQASEHLVMLLTMFRT